MSVDLMLIYDFTFFFLFFFSSCFNVADAAVISITKVMHVLLMLLWITMLLYPIPLANNIMNLKVGRKIK